MDFKAAESKRPEFESHPMKISRTVDPDWRVGGGLNSHPQAALFHQDAKFKSIQPGSTEMAAMDIYKLMITGIVRVLLLYFV